MEKCLSCQFYDRKHAAGEARSLQWGQCRRTSPMLSPMTAKSYMIEGVWPTVRDDDWCGEWKLQAARRMVESVAATHATKAPHVAAVPRTAPLAGSLASSVAAASAIGGSALAGAFAPVIAGD